MFTTIRAGGIEGRARDEQTALRHGIVGQETVGPGGFAMALQYREDIPQPFTMWLYPVPAVVSLALWLYIFYTGPVAGMMFSVGFLLTAVAAYYLFVGRRDPAAEAI